MAAACDDENVGDRLELAIGASEPLVLETACEGLDCQNSATLVVTYPEDYTETDVVELEQYRVDYDIAGVRRELPYYAEPLDVRLAPGERASINLRLLGEAQRQAIVAETQGAVVRGTALITLAGYDFDDAQIFPELEVDIELRPTRGSTSASETDDGRIDFDDSTTDGGDGE